MIVQLCQRTAGRKFDRWVGFHIVVTAVGVEGFFKRCLQGFGSRTAAVRRQRGLDGKFDIAQPGDGAVSFGHLVQIFLCAAECGNVDSEPLILCGDAADIGQRDDIAVIILVIGAVESGVQQADDVLRILAHKHPFR